ncbi:MAG: hypothetical protein ACXV2D_08960, partial [Halobacteriota archaeon]
ALASKRIKTASSTFGKSYTKATDTAIKPANLSTISARKTIWPVAFLRGAGNRSSRFFNALAEGSAE